MTDFSAADREEAFAAEYSRLVTRLVRTYFLNGGDRDDLYQEGMIGLLYAIRRYDPARSDNFEAFAHLCIKNRLNDVVRSDISLNRKEAIAAEKLRAAAISLDRDKLSDPETLCMAYETAKEIQAGLGGLLSAFEASVLEPYLEGFTIGEIASKLEREAKSVDNAVMRIRRKLAKYLQGDNRL